MRIDLYLRASVILLCASLLASCVQFGDDTTGPEELGTRTASFKVDGKLYTKDKPYMAIYDDNGEISNWIIIESSDGSELQLKWEGTSPGTYQLKGFSTGSWDSPDGEHYNPISGELVITSYRADPDNVSYVASGTFRFVGESIENSAHKIQVTDGVLTNAANRLD